MELVKLKVQDFNGDVNALELPTGLGISLMEALRASGYDIQATCGGMALCATCHVDVLSGLERLPVALDAELEMLDSLPIIHPGSRLSCQIRVDDSLHDSEIKLIG